MKRIIIVVEGQTEQEFVNQSVQPYLAETFGIYAVSARLIGKPGHKGGNVRFSRLKKDVDLLLQEEEVVVSTFIDYFRLANDFPDFGNCQSVTSADGRIDCIEKGMETAVNSTFFIPYIQKYEFEALLFSSTEGFQKYLSRQTCQAVEEVVHQFANPEDINNQMPPSYRLKEIFERYEGEKYDKVAFGNILALETGIRNMLGNCSRFANWIDKLSRMAIEN